jgi:hypothetical protein
VNQPERVARQATFPRSRVPIEIAIVLAGGTLVACALAANRTWLDRHFLPSFFLPRRWYVLIETVVRIGLAAVGLSLALVARRRIAHMAVSALSQAIPVTMAVLLALGAGELVLRSERFRSHGWTMADEEPRRRPDPRLGWTLEPARTGHNQIAGRILDYAIDPAGYRVRRVDEPVDPERPTVLFTGESVMFGEGLTWEESIPAQVGALMGLQSANLAVHGYGNDQAYLRLQAELPRFRHPVAVVSLFMPTLFGRNLDQDRPHLGPGLVWLPGRERSRLGSLATLVVPFRSGETVDRGITMTRQVLRATIDLAHSRGAAALILVPQLGEDDALQRSLRLRVLDQAGLPYLLVETPGAWRLSWDVHPNAAAARVIAEAVAARLRER